jgi:hypothetical protein
MGRFDTVTGDGMSGKERRNAAKLGADVERHWLRTPSVDVKRETPHTASRDVSAKLRWPSALAFCDDLL